MKKILVGFMALACLVSVSLADSYTYTITVTNGQPITYSDPLPVSGYLDKIEITPGDAAATGTVTVATYVGTTAAETFATKALSNAATTTLFRPRVMGTTSAGVAIAATTNPAGTVATSLLGVYEKPLLGGNLKCAVTGTLNDGSCLYTITLYYEPIKH